MRSEGVKLLLQHLRPDGWPERRAGFAASPSRFKLHPRSLLAHLDARHSTTFDVPFFPVGTSLPPLLFSFNFSLSLRKATRGQPLRRSLLPPALCTTHQRDNLSPRHPILLHSRHILIQLILTSFASPHPPLPLLNLGLQQPVRDRRGHNLVERGAEALVADELVGVFCSSPVLTREVAFAGLLTRGTVERGADGDEVGEVVLLLLKSEKEVRVSWKAARAPRPEARRAKASAKRLNSPIDAWRARERRRTRDTRPSDPIVAV